MQSMKTRFVGLGIHVARTDDGNIEIISVEPGGPAFKGGLRPKDVIVGIDDKPVRDMRFIEAMKMVSGVSFSAGSKVKLSIRRQGAGSSVDITLTREFIEVKKVEWKLFGAGYGYVKLTGFYKNSTADFKAALTEMETKGSLKGLIIDLRNNPGGDSESCVALAKLFVDSGTITSLESNFPAYNVKIRGDNGSIYKMPVVIIVDEGSASASELFSGALRFNGRAKLIGRKTHGKGTMQTFMPASDDAGLYVTIGRFYMPDGTSIEGKGLVPDVTVAQGLKDEELLNRAVQLIKSGR